MFIILSDVCKYKLDTVIADNLTNRKNGVFVDDEDAQNGETNRFSTKSA